MTFAPREYQDIVRDVLTNLTQGVTREIHPVVVGAEPPARPEFVLRRRPVRRVSHVSGFVAAADPEQPPVPYTFTRNDFELVGDPEDPAALTRLRFFAHGRKPAPGTNLSVNYYPRSTDPAPITDLNVGSVARVLVEALSRELAVLYAQLGLVYEAGFVETASGRALDRVVALLGYSRFAVGRPVGTVTFRRRAGAIGNITIPAGTPITDTEDSLRYETSESRVMLAGETTALVRVRGASASTPVVKAGVLAVIQRAIAGIDQVTNESDASRASEDESDEELRARARDALLAAGKGTVEALRFGLLQMPEVRDVRITERPSGVAGEIKVTVSLADPGADPDRLPPSVQARLDQLRPAGIRVVTGGAQAVRLRASVELVLAGSAVAESELRQVKAKATAALVEAVARTGVGQRLRAAPLTALLLRDERIVDAKIAFGAEGEPPGTPGQDFQPAEGVTLQLAAEQVVFAAPSFEGAPPGAPETTTVEVRASIGATPESGVAPDAVASELRQKLEAFFASVTAGASIDTPTLLAALRNDARYAIDPLRLVVTLSAEGQFVQLAQGGPAFLVRPGQSFRVASLELAR